MERFWYHFLAMLKIRLKRVGRKNQPAFRVVVTDSRTGPKSSKHVAEVGSYNPRTKERKLDGDAIKHWIGNGAQVSDTVYNMLVDEGLVEGKKKNVLPRKSPVVKEQEEQEEKAEEQEETGGESEVSSEEVKAEEPKTEEEKPAEPEQAEEGPATAEEAQEPKEE